ncbi:hypothetical protein ACLOJK_011156 [Asimina triloba]
MSTFGVKNSNSSALFHRPHICHRARARARAIALHLHRLPLLPITSLVVHGGELFSKVARAYFQQLISAIAFSSSSPLASSLSPLSPFFQLAPS